ncbi:MAG: hypothetical protein CMA79_03645 [Euryarchaeota archaeon]|nr:hypothetical protein [Euryarchaeota archaeon]MBN55018.1 hypothetical protein [Euryarchaeota archaeon]MBN55512.1 hypothetical protein [Euryarchaeota archaeon]MED5397757.1 hypothetical protein [Candidatus Thermoplasmatota archaeon]
MGGWELLRPAKKVPTTRWSSSNPMSTRPRLSTLSILLVGEFLFGLGDAFLIVAGVGNTPWTVLAEGIATVIGWSIGKATFLVSAAVLLLWIPIREVPGIGTLLNAIIIAATIELTVDRIPASDDILVSFLQVCLGILLIGIGSAMYLTANLGPGPRDGWMTGLQRVTGVPIGRVRVTIEISVLVIGVLLGGTFGYGTVLFAFAIGPVVAVCLAAAGRIGSED